MTGLFESKMQHISGVEINFFDNLPEKISTCLKKNGTLSFEVNLEKRTEFCKIRVVSRIKFLCAIVKIM